MTTQSKPELQEQPNTVKSLPPVQGKRSGSLKAGLFAMSITPVLMIAALLGFGLTNYRNIFIKLLGTLIILSCLGLALWWLIILGKSILAEPEQGGKG